LISAGDRRTPVQRNSFFHYLEVLMKRISVGKAGDFPPGTIKAADAVGKEILVVNSGGKFYAIARRCTHRGGDLSNGVLEGSSVRCPRHGALFDLETGKCVEGPKIGPLKLNTRDETCFPVSVEGGEIFVQV
jgi:3-phenylpropionate/trans-cinnamate dioxygenase ferredoxin subunit